MVDIRLEGSVNEIVGASNRIAATGRDPACVLNAMGEQMIKTMQERFDRQ